MNTINVKPLTVSVDAAITLSGIGRTKFYELIKQQVVKTVLVGKRRLVIFSSLEELLHAAQ